jgi:hypothetical protein
MDAISAEDRRDDDEAVGAGGNGDESEGRLDEDEDEEGDVVLFVDESEDARYPGVMLAVNPSRSATP